MSSSSEGLRDERRICRIHFSMRITDVAYETTCHGRRSSPSDSLIGRRHGDDGETEVHDDRCPWGLVGSGRQAGQRAPGDLSGEGVEVCRVVISCGELSELVRGETRYDDQTRSKRGNMAAPEPSAPDASPMRCRCTRERFATVPAARPAPMCSSWCRLRVPEYLFGASAFWDCMCTVWDCPPGQKKCLPCRAAAPVNRLRLSPHDSRPRTGQRPPAVADTAFSPSASQI